MKHETRMIQDPNYRITSFVGGVYYYRLPGRGITIKYVFEPIVTRLNRSVSFAVEEMTKTVSTIVEEITEAMSATVEYMEENFKTS